MKRTQLYKEALVASLLVVVVDFLLSFVPWKFELIKPIKQGFNDFSLYDLRYAGIDTVIGPKDTSITVLQIGSDRREIAEEIRCLSGLHPRVIGLDATFFQPSDSPAMDRALVNAMKGAEHLVLASHIGTVAPFVQRSWFQDSLPMARDGHYDLVEGDEEICRRVSPIELVDGRPYPSLPGRMLQEISPLAYDNLLRRGNRYETINYSGGLNYFNVVSLKRFQHPDHEEDLTGYFRDKIVLIGYFNDAYPDVLEDMHFTPMNHKRGGKSFPDSYGVFIHANVLEMMLKGNYIHELSAWAMYSTILVLIFFINILYIRRMSRKRAESRFILFLLQFVLAIGLLYIALLLFDWFDIAADIMPLLIAVVLSFEIFWLYEWLARQLNKYFKYATFLAHPDHPAD